MLFPRCKGEFGEDRRDDSETDQMYAKKDRQALGREGVIQGHVKITKEIYEQGSATGYVKALGL